MKVILPGSYDPITLGHLDLIRRAAAVHEDVRAVIFVNPEKKYMFSVEERLEMLRLATADMPNVSVDFSDGMVIDYMREQGLEKIIKGYRSESDIAYEKLQAEYNLSVGGVETELYECNEGLGNVSSTLARARILAGEDVSEILPGAVSEYIYNKIKK